LTIRDNLSDNECVFRFRGFAGFLDAGQFCSPDTDMLLVNKKIFLEKLCCAVVEATGRTSQSVQVIDIDSIEEDGLRWDVKMAKKRLDGNILKQTLKVARRSSTRFVRSISHVMSNRTNNHDDDDHHDNVPPPPIANDSFKLHRMIHL